MDQQFPSKNLHCSVISNAGLLHEQNMAKMRLLTFMGMAVENKEISFDTMQQELQVGADDVEAFVIDGKRGYMIISYAG